MTQFVTKGGRTYKTVLIPVGNNAARNATPSAKAARKRWDRKRYTLLCAQVEKETAGAFKAICETEGITVNAAIRRLVDRAIRENCIIP